MINSKADNSKTFMEILIGFPIITIGKKNGLAVKGLF